MQKQPDLPFLTINHKAFEAFQVMPKSATLVFMYLAKKAPRIFPKQTTIAREVGIGISTARRALKLLETHKIIKRHRNYKCPTVYSLHPLFLLKKMAKLHADMTVGMINFFSRVAKEHGRRFYCAGRYPKTVTHNQNKYIKY